MDKEYSYSTDVFGPYFNGELSKEVSENYASNRLSEKFIPIMVRLFHPMKGVELFGGH
jgi:hypothetical protein